MTRKHRPPSHRQHQVLLDYIDKRSWDTGTAIYWGLRVVDVGPSWGSLRIRHPFHPGHEHHGWQDYLPDPPTGQPKWLTKRGWSPTLFNADAIRHLGPGELLSIVEGPADAITLEHAHHRTSIEPLTAVAVPGAAAWDHSYARQIAAQGITPVICVDNDPAGDGLRRRIDSALRAAGVSPCHVYVPRRQGWSDIGDWYLAVGATKFCQEYAASVADAEDRARWVLATSQAH